MSQSRQFTIVDVPDPVNIKAEFVYNFFVPDERRNAAGDERVPGVIGAWPTAADIAAGKTEDITFEGTLNQTQRLIKAGTLKSEVPRYVKVTITPPPIIEVGNFGDAKSNINLNNFELGDITAEESITNEAFAAIRESDPSAESRIADKVKSLSTVLGIDFSNSNQSGIIANLLGIERGLIQHLISPYGDPKDLKVNFKPLHRVGILYDTAAKLSLSSLISKRVLSVSVRGADDTSPLSKFEIQQQAQKIAKDFLTTANSDSLTESDLEPTLRPLSHEEVSDRREILGAQIVGYTLIRKQLSPSGRLMETKVFPITGRENIQYLDSQVVYGGIYHYSVRAVYRVDAVITSPVDGHEKNWRISTIIASRPSNAVSVLTEEFDPPSFPDGVFHKFNYNRGRGLIITWQMPSGRSRDVKFFQVFKRFSIYEPFQCIGEIDFDNSSVRTMRPEVVRNELIIRKSGAWTMFEDRRFNRDTESAIYAVCAIDAHGLSSGYSSQTQVGFDKTKNRLTLKNISRPGAPKQYPNFFVDPDLDDNIAVDSFTQDAIFDSGRTRMDVYFTPDAITATTAAGSVIDVLVTDKSQGKYKMHILNLDLQKSTTAEIKISDLQQT